MLNRLPYEVIREIIKLSYAYTSHSLTPMNLDGTVLPPVEASHVCRSLRIALLSDSRLWTCIIIPQMPPDEIHELFHRSGTAPLHVFIDSIDCNHHRLGHLLDTLVSTFGAIDRFQSLQIILKNEKDDARMQDLAYFILPYLNRPAPMLQKFYLDITKQGGGWANNEEFLQKLFSCGNNSNSQHIESDIWVDFHERLRSPGQLFRNLSALHLKIGLDTVFADALLDVIELSPNLRILDIRSILSPEVSDNSPGRTLYLPRLQQLTLSGSTEVAMVNLVLGHLKFQLENVIWDISCEDFHFKKSDSALISWLLGQRHFAFLELHQSSCHGQVQVDFSTHSCNPWGPESSCFQTTYDICSEEVDDLPDMLQGFRLSLITHLVLGSTPLSSSILRNIFVSLVSLEHCRVTHRHHYWRNIIDASCVMALIPWHARQQAQQQAGMQGPSDFAKSLDIVVSQDVDDSNSSAACTMFPCPSLATLYINIFDEKWKMDERYARLLAACSEIRQQERHPFSLITVHCWKSSLTDDVQAMLQPQDGFPIAIEFRD